MKRTWVYDLETLNIFTATFIDKESDDERVFVISSTRDDRAELFYFLDNEVQGLIGYNCITFDAQILEFLYRNPDATAQQIRTYAEIITQDNNRRPDVPQWQLRIPHLDLFRALSLSVKAKRTSLKWCEFGMDLDNIEDMPNQGEGDNWEEMVLAYNKNDVIATKKLLQRYYYEVELRKVLSDREGINLLNSTEPDMAKRLFSKYLSRAMKIKENDLRTMGTKRDIVKVNDIILPYINFKSKALNNILTEFRKLNLTEFDSFSYNFLFGGIELNYGLGGIHGSLNNKIVHSDEKLIIKSCDAKSMYPNIAIQNKLHPAHLPQEIFCNLYENLYNERASIPKSDPRNYILKITLNALYGLTNDKFSFVRDREMTVSICINGQLLLSMLFERMILEIPECRLLMANTDGFEVLIPREYQEQYTQICKEWEQITKLELEFVDYKSMIISDVNNYISITTEGKTKLKGRYEFENIPLHKNKSHSIIPKAIYNYFVNNIPVEDTITKDTNIFNFCAGVRAKRSEIKGASRYELHSVINGQIVKQKLSRTVRYFISKKGGYLIKFYESGAFEHVEAPLKFGSRIKDWKVTYFNKVFHLQNFTEYNIDYSYYIYKAKEWIAEIEDKQQMKLF